MQGGSNIPRTEKANFKCHLLVSLSPYRPSYMELGREENEKKIMIHLKDTLKWGVKTLSIIAHSALIHSSFNKLMDTNL